MNMTLATIARELGLELLNKGIDLERGVSGGYVSDLLSDVMGNAKEGEIWITLQAHANVVAIASLKELAAIVLVNGITPQPAVLQKASEEDIPVLSSSEGTFATAGKLFELLDK